MKMVKKHMKTCSTSLILREPQVKATRIYHFTSSWMAIIKKIITSLGKDMERLVPPYTSGGNIKW